MRTLYWVVALILAIGITAVVAPRVAAARRPGLPPAAPATPIGSLKDVMEGIVEPSANVLWDAVSVNVGDAGVQENKPTTEEQWAMLRHNALMLAEAGNLLKMTRPVARADQPSEPAKPDAPELTPPEIQQKIEHDRTLWNKYADALQEKAVVAMRATTDHDADALLNVGAEIDTACENCHLEYWYPKDKKPGAAPALRRQG
jgi:hypothetical protein